MNFQQNWSVLFTCHYPDRDWGALRSQMSWSPGDLRILLQSVVPGMAGRGTSPSTRWQWPRECWKAPDAGWAQPVPLSALPASSISQSGPDLQNKSTG